MPTQLVAQEGRRQDGSWNHADRPIISSETQRAAVAVVNEQLVFNRKADF